MQNNSGQGVSHATGGSHVPEAVQKKAPSGLEESLPNPVHDTTGADGQDTQGKGVSHALDKPDASKVPETVQKAVPEKLERALPNAIHDTGSTK
ncbi:hypothetical protein K504DRAFT_538057 [Pleomassaria siparia CBS 279.74]|uniref:Uncharacterized protein n=1 Tax=Pleomassaria siparia CBS 279.74 TaxID=1314801 RepID=A0A6G1JWC3_9PLEO|nr:hypothetical protein K504DRAFT_538057 [Pleomassaria siparia CBS 279.74]